MDDIVSAKSHLFVLLASSDTDVFSQKGELTKKQQIASWSSDVKGGAEPRVERHCDLVQVRCTASESGNAVCG